jgi:hypothetical protein
MEFKNRLSLFIGDNMHLFCCRLPTRKFSGKSSWFLATAVIIDSDVLAITKEQLFAQKSTKA